jgi:ribosomal protein S18 acetylase RimI-like enzyme
MNFYSDKLVNEIIDNKPLEDVLELIEKFIEETFNIIARYSSKNIHEKYIFNVLSNTKNVIAFHCLDNEFSISNCPSILVYRKFKCYNEARNINEIRYYVLIACTKKKFRNQGYASKLLDGLVERITKENEGKPEVKLKIILSSVEESVIFYENYGFKWTRESIIDHPLIMRYERYEKKKEYFIMEMCV